MYTNQTLKYDMLSGLVWPATVGWHFGCHHFHEQFRNFVKFCCSHCWRYHRDGSLTCMYRDGKFLPLADNVITLENLFVSAVITSRPVLYMTWDAVLCWCHTATWWCYASLFTIRLRDQLVLFLFIIPFRCFASFSFSKKIPLHVGITYEWRVTVTYCGRPPSCRF